MRLIVGPRHSILLPTSVIGGALVITGADLAARTMVGDADLPLGMFTALIGGPVFFILLRRSRRGSGLVTGGAATTPGIVAEDVRVSWAAERSSAASRSRCTPVSS